MICARLLSNRYLALLTVLVLSPLAPKAQTAAPQVPPSAAPRMPHSAKPQVQPKMLAATPPMGWNSWDAYGFTIDEAQFRDNVKVMADLRHYGWQYAVIDEGWYMRNPYGKDLASMNYLYDKHGLLEPVQARFPSATHGQGFKALADWVHSQGLKFGIHIVRGIPKQVVQENLPIAGSHFHAADAADKSATCPWDFANYGVADNAAGQAYYDSMLRKYAQWGLDFLKVDCIADHPYRITEIRQIAEAIRKTGRPIVLSLSPGPTNLSHAEEVGKYAQMWRISNDHWDAWEFKNHTADGFPFGLGDEFDRIAEWNKYVKPGNWPDPDMLPEGSLTPHAGWGEPRQSRFTHDEQQTEFTLWCISRAPLIFGGNMTKLDLFTRSLMKNQDLIAADQRATESHPVTDLPAGFEKVRVWESRKGTTEYIALFNLSESPKSIKFSWKQVGAERGHAHARNVFSGKLVSASAPVSVTLPPHGSTMYRLQ